MKKSEMIDELIAAGYESAGLKKLLKDDIVEIYNDFKSKEEEVVIDEPIIIEEDGKKYFEIEIDINSLSQNELRTYMRTGLLP